MKKKILSVLTICAVMVIGTSCGASSDNNVRENTSTHADNNTESKSMIDSLSEKEKKLFDALLIVSKDFYEPSKMKVMEVGDYSEKTRYENDEHKDILYGTDSIVVRLQGENRVGGTVNHYYKVVLTAANAKDNKIYEIRSREYTSANISVALADNSNQKLSREEARARVYGEMLEYVGEVGDYSNLGDNYTIEYEETEFDIGKINKA